MSKFQKTLLNLGYVCIALVILGVVILLSLLNSDTFKQRMESTLSASFNREVLINGGLEASFMHGFLIDLNDLHVLHEEQEIANARKLSIGIDLLPLLHGEIRLNTVAIQDLVATVVRHEDGSYNFILPDPRVTLKLDRISVVNANIHFTDTAMGREYSATSCSLEVQGLTPVNRDDLQKIRSLDILANLDCTELGNTSLTLGNVNLELRGGSKMFTFKPLTMELFGAHGSGSLEVDFNKEEPLYSLLYELPQFHVEKSLAHLSQQHAITGAMDFSTHLTARGLTLPAVKQSLAGQILLQGKDLIFTGSNLDEQLAKFEASQNFDLVDAGAVLFTGPLGLVVTKGFDFANIFLESGPSSEIPAVISQWIVMEGIAHAQDVAMSTNENLIALKGELDLPAGQFRNMTLALLDEKGCARITQVIEGGFQNPEIDKPGIISSLTGPVSALFHKLNPDEDCTVFYSGTLAEQR